MRNCHWVSTLYKATITLILSISLVGCGGGGGGGGESTTVSSTNETVTETQINQVSGTVSTGAGLDDNLTVTLKSATQPQVNCDSSAETFVCSSLSGLTPPFILKATGTTDGRQYIIYSATVSSAVANINPLTNLILSSVVESAGLSDVYTDFSTYSERVSANLELLSEQAQNGILSQLATDFGFSGANQNPFSGALEAGSGLDTFFKFFEIQIDPQGLFLVFDKYASTTLVEAELASLESLFLTNNTLTFTDISDIDMNSPVTLKRLTSALALPVKVELLSTQQ